MSSLVVEELGEAAEGGGERPEPASASSPDKLLSSPSSSVSPSSARSGDSPRSPGGLNTLFQQDLPAGRWDASVHGGRVVTTLAKTCADILAAYRSFEALPTSGGGGADDGKIVRRDRGKLLVTPIPEGGSAVPGLPDRLP